MINTDNQFVTIRRNTPEFNKHFPDLKVKQ
jgi:hypothetical protein